MSAGKVFVVSTGTANLASVEACLVRCGVTPERVTRPEEVSSAERLVVPGVGTLAAALVRLRGSGYLAPLAQRLERGLPTLGICLGLQLLAEGSDESPDEIGLALLPGRSRRFPSTVRVPQIGWNRVRPESGNGWLEEGFAYFANSYYLAEAPGDDWQCAWARHGVRFVAAVSRGRVLACQFHPELSGAWGQRLVERWLEGGTS